MYQQIKLPQKNLFMEEKGDKKEEVFDRVYERLHKLLKLPTGFKCRYKLSGSPVYFFGETRVSCAEADRVGNIEQALSDACCLGETSDLVELTENPSLAVIGDWWREYNQAVVRAKVHEIVSEVVKK